MTTIEAISVALGDGRLTNDQLAREHPGWEMDLVTELSGVQTRRVVAASETAFDLSVRACQALADEHTLDLASVDAILYCTQSADYRVPGNSHLLHRQLGLSDRVLAFDFTLACSGYVYGLAIADSFLRSRLASQVLLVNAETPSKLISPDDRSVVPLFGDGAAATYLSAGNRPGGQIVGARMCSNGAALDRVLIPAGGARMPSSAETRREVADQDGSVRTSEHLLMDGPGVWAFINSTIPGHVRSFLGERGLTVDDIDLFVFHQASKLVLGSLAKAIGLDEKKVFVHMEEIGNLSSASIPVALRAALDQRAITAGNRVLLTAYGAGMSYGSVLVQY